MRACKDCRWCEAGEAVTSALHPLSPVDAWFCTNPDVTPRDQNYYEGREVLMPLNIQTARGHGDMCGYDAVNFAEKPA